MDYPQILLPRQTIPAGMVIGALLLLAYLSCFHYTPQHKIGIRWNEITGVASIDPHPGFFLTPPWVLVAKIETRPIRICITSRSRSVNCKLVRFVPENFEQLIAVEGWRYYWWDNRISFNWGHDEEYRGTRDLLRGHAYSVKQFGFIKVETELSDVE